MFDPAIEAHRLQVTGMNWRDVAAITGYPSVDACRMAVHAMLTRAAAQTSRQQLAERLEVELERLDEVQVSFWAAMKMGDEKAANVVLNVIRTRAKLLGLETREAEAAVTKTVVIAGSTEEYVAGLRRLVEGEA